MYKIISKLKHFIRLVFFSNPLADESKKNKTLPTFSLKNVNKSNFSIENKKKNDKWTQAENIRQSENFLLKPATKFS